MSACTSSMTVSERFHATMNFEPADRMPLIEWAIWWDKTLARWHSEGLDRSLDRYDLYRQFGLDVYCQAWCRATHDDAPQPAHEGAGIIQTMDDYEQLKEKLFRIDDPRSVNTADLDRWTQWKKEGEAAIWFTLDGFFWYPRTLLGVQEHLYAFYDEPEMMHQINRDNAEWMIKMINHICEHCQPDFMTFAEDMSYNNGPMISKELFDEFMKPYYNLVIPHLKERGIRVFIDSDGDVHEAAPWFAEAGIEGILPLERQAGVDVAELQKENPGQLYIGAFDKMTMPEGKAAMREEFERLLPAGGFPRPIPYLFIPAERLCGQGNQQMILLTKKIRSKEEVPATCESLDLASWIWHPGVLRNQPAVLQFSIDFTATDDPITFHVSADQRFSLKLDGSQLMRGPDAGDPAHWPFATYQLRLPRGPHRLTADVWWIGSHAPLARMTVEGGFILKAEGPHHQQLTTGIAPWKVKRCPEYSFSPWEIEDYQAVGDQLCINGPLREKNSYVPALNISSASHKPVHGLYENKWVLTPTSLPDQLSLKRTCGTVRAVQNEPVTPDQPIPAEALCHPDIPSIQTLLNGGGTLAIPADSCLSFLCDLEDYVCAYPKLRLSGGLDAQIRWSWAESLYEKDLTTKNNRNQVEGLFFSGITDRFISSGKENQEYETLWWRAGRYILLSIQTAEEPLVFQSLEIEETRYPLENDSRFLCDEPEVQELIQICFRGLQSNSHEKAADCPYYEQLMYAGDTRLQALIQYATSSDEGLPRRCIELFNGSRASGCSGLTTARYPDRDTQWIPPFSLIWIWMVHDYFYWRDDPPFVADQLLGIRSVLNAFTAFLNKDHLLENIPHWVFVDWVDEWFEGYPPGAQGGISSLVNLMYIQTLEKAIELESALGSGQQADLYRNQRDLTGQAVVETFWNSTREMMADDTAHEHFSEHGQALTALCTSLGQTIRKNAVQALCKHKNTLTPASIYFSFYVFEALFSMNKTATIRSRLEPWMQLAGQGFKTPPEEFGHSRSDCHAWGSHPLYHFHTGVLGVRAAAPGFRTVLIQPRDIGWKNISGTTRHPKGTIDTSFVFSKNKLTGTVVLPAETTGTLAWAGQSVKLTSGENPLSLRRSPPAKKETVR